jgi:hypothetical protein
MFSHISVSTVVVSLNILFALSCAFILAVRVMNYFSSSTFGFLAAIDALGVEKVVAYGSTLLINFL